MGKSIMGAVVSLDGYIADVNGEVGPLFDWLGNGDVELKFTEEQEHPARTTQASADFMRAVYPRIGAVVIGRRTFDQTNGWGARRGRPRLRRHPRPADRLGVRGDRAVHVRDRRRRGRLTEAGLEPEPVRYPGGSEGPKTSWLTDPDGYRIELVEWPPGHPDGITAADFP
jgi:dihydrofolate reductase